MTENRLKWILLAFLIGAGMGAGLSVLMMVVYNRILLWTGGSAVKITRLEVLPLALLIGLSMAINMAHPPFGD